MAYQLLNRIFQGGNYPHDPRRLVMVQALCTSGNHEGLKCGVHGAACAVAVVMAAYNIAACCFRRDRHLRINAVVYTLAVGWEIKQTLHHLKRTSLAAEGTAATRFPAARCA